MSDHPTDAELASLFEHLAPPKRDEPVCIAGLRLVPRGDTWSSEAAPPPGDPAYLPALWVALDAAAAGGASVTWRRAWIGERLRRAVRVQSVVLRDEKCGKTLDKTTVGLLLAAGFVLDGASFAWPGCHVEAYAIQHLARAIAYCSAHQRATHADWGEGRSTGPAASIAESDHGRWLAAERVALDELRRLGCDA